MLVYAESSAVLAWLLGEARADEVRDALNAATAVVVSDLTDIECARAIHRAVALGAITAQRGSSVLELYSRVADAWDRLAISERVVARAAEPFPVEPVRALDAIHLAAALVARDQWRTLAVLSFDERVLANAAALGLTVLPNRP